MTDRSVNGWIVLHNYPPDSGTFLAPGGKTVYCNSREVAIIFEDFARWWHANITPIAVSHPANRQRPRERHGTTPDGKWDAVGIHCWRKGTKIAGTDRYSNHCSATGMDINGHLHPYEYTAGRPFRDGLTSAHKAAIRAKCRSVGVLRHGIDFVPGRTDPMHVEIGPGVSRTSVQQAAKRLENDVGRSSTANVLWRGAYGHDVADLQGQLNRAGFNAGTEDGQAGAKFDAAVRALQKAAGITVDGRVGPGTREALALAAVGEALEPITEEAELMAAKDDIINALSERIDRLPLNIWQHKVARAGEREPSIYTETLLRYGADRAGQARIEAALAEQNGHPVDVAALAALLLPDLTEAIKDAGSTDPQTIVDALAARLAPQED